MVLASPDTPWHERFASYMYPAPYERTLRNLADIRQFGFLMDFEYRAAALRRDELAARPELVAHTFDAAHLRALHGHLFQDVYEWAGEYRTINMTKDENNRRGFGNWHNGEIDRLLQDARTMITKTDWVALDERQFADAAAEVFAWVNQAHPFREGNGRASKLFMEHVAELSPYELDFSVIGATEWNLASQRSAPIMGAYAPNPEPLQPVFRRAVVIRDPAQPVATLPSERPAPMRSPEAFVRTLNAVRAVGAAAERPPAPAPSSKEGNIAPKFPSIIPETHPPGPPGHGRGTDRGR